MSNLKPLNVVISGTNFWNPGDDFVRDGVVRILKNLFPGHTINFLFYNFNQDFFPQNKFSGINNMLSKGDLELIKYDIDAVVIAGLSAGFEIKDLYNWVIENNLLDRVYLIGAGYENDYVEKFIKEEPELTIFKNARVITGRTKKKPALISDLKLPYHHINCPAILSVDKVKDIPADKKIERIAFSIQLPKEIGISNHTCHISMYELAIKILVELYGKYEIDFIAHHKTEYFHFINLFKQYQLPINVIFSSFYQDLHKVYPEYDLIITTRLHSSLFANGFGIPGIIINDTDRHTHCLEGFEHSHWVNSKEKFDEVFRDLNNASLSRINNEIKIFKENLTDQYLNALSEPFNSDLKGTKISNLKYDKLNIGCGNDYREGFLNVDGNNKLKTDLVLNIEPGTLSSVFNESSFSYVLAKDFLEHHFHWEARKLLEDFHFILKPGGILELILPNIENIITDNTKSFEDKRIWLYGGQDLPQEWEKDNPNPARKKYPQYFCHKFGWTKELLTKELEEVGFSIQKFENQGWNMRLLIEKKESVYNEPDSFLSINNEKNDFPAHFFTIVLNGFPFIRHHINEFKNLPFKWHWHIIEGVADLKHDTAWSVECGGKISPELHRNGLSKDGTSEYLNDLKKLYPENISIYRKPKNEFWDGKLEMVNTPLNNINEESLLWQIDSDELWKTEQIIKVRDIFLSYPEKTSAYYYCNYFVGENLVTTTRNTYGNHTDYEWIRTWRFMPGDQWIAHEPPRLCRKISNQQWADLAKVNPFLHKETEFYGLIFQHYAYVTEEQLKFKEVYYGYKNAIEQWKSLQQIDYFPVKLKNYFKWVEDETEVNTIDSQGINPLVRKGENDAYAFISELNNQKEWNRILYVRTDSIGDNILSLPILQHLKINYPDADIAVVCQQHIAEIYESNPSCNTIIAFEKNKIFTDEFYRNSILQRIDIFNPDVVINPVYSREPLTDFLSLNNSAIEKITFEGDNSNITSDELERNRKAYTQLITNDNLKTEIERNRHFLSAVNIGIKDYSPFIWTNESDEAFAEDLFKMNNLDSEKTIALFPFSQEEAKNYKRYDEIVNELSDYTFLILGGIENQFSAEELVRKINGKSFNLTGRTSIRQMTALIKRCTLFIGADSAGVHIACSVNTPNVVLLGGGHFGRFLPYSNLTTVVCKPLDCYGCNWKCKYEKSICIKDIDPLLVNKAARDTLASISSKPKIYLQTNEQNNNLLLDDLSKYIDLEKVSVIESSQSYSVRTKLKSDEKLRISVITPSYNQAAYLERTIKSVIDQKYPALEYIIIDGGSNDGSADIIKKYDDKISYWVTEKDNGQADAVNKGLRKASGEIIGWLNSDDWYEPGVFEAVNEFFIKNPDKNIVMGNCKLVDSEGKAFNEVKNFERGFDELKKYWIGQSIPTQPSVFFRKKLLDENGYLETDLFYAMDYDLWMKFALTNRFYHINKTFANYRFHSEAKGGDQDWSKFSKEWNLVFNKYVQKGNTPLVSVIIPCFNYARFLPEAVESVARQTFSDFEIVIVNDGSTDNSKEIAESLVLKYQNNYRIKLIDQPNSGQPAIARNNGIKEAKGEYILCLDADDKIDPSMLEKCLFTLEAFPDIGIAYTHRQDFDGADQLVEALEYDFETLKKQNILSVCSLFRKKAWVEVGGYRTNVKGLEDWDFWIALGTKGYFGRLIPEPLFFYRRHDSGVFQEAIRDQKKKFAQIILNNKSVYPAGDVKAAEIFLEEKKDELVDFSVIIPTYNRKDELKKALKSVLNQTHNNFEVIVVNDAGQDVSDIVNSFNDNRIKYISHKKNKGLAASRNTGIKNSSGKYIALLDDDDIYYPHHLHTAFAELVLGHKVIYTDALRASFENKKLISKEVPYSIDYDRNKLLIGNIAPVNCFVFEKDAAVKAGLFDESLPVLEDWEFWIRLSSLTEFKHIKTATVQVNWKNDGSTMTSSKQMEFGETRNKIYQRYEKEIIEIPYKEKIFEEFNNIWKNDFNLTKPLVSIIVLTYNGLDYTKQFISSLLQNTHENFELIIVDNASTDGTVEYLKDIEKVSEDLKIIYNTENLGYPAGVNQGILSSSGYYIVLANNDILFSEGWLERLIEAAEYDSKIGIVGPVSNEVSGMQRDDNAVYSSAEEMVTYADRIKKENKGDIFEFPRITFICALINREVFNKIGGLDERFSPGNFEDDDFCLRAQLAGFKAFVAKDVFIHHYGSKSFTADGLEKYKERLEANKNIFINKWGADPEEIWLHGKKVNNKNLLYPINQNKFSQYFDRALIHIEEKEFHPASISVLKAIEFYDDNFSEKISRSDLFNLAGNIELFLENITPARDYFEKALNINPESSLACHGLAEIFVAEDNYESAKIMLEYAVHYNNKNIAAQEALIKVNHLLQIHSDNVQDNSPSELQTKFSEILSSVFDLFQLKKYNEAFEALNNTEELFYSQLNREAESILISSYENLKGLVLLALDKTDEAKNSFESALNINPSSCQACAGLGEVFFIEGRNKESKEMYEWAVKNNPENKFAVEGLSKINSLLGLKRTHSSLLEDNASTN